MAYEIPIPRDISWYGTPQSHGAQCHLCPARGEQIVPYSPPAPGKKLRLVIVGEGPGRKEILQRRPFCLIPETLVLMADLTWRPLGNVQVGDRIITIEENPERTGEGVSGSAMRRWVVATVTARMERDAPTFRVETATGRELIGTGDHRVLVQSAQGARKWRAIEDLRVYIEQTPGEARRKWSWGSRIVSIGAPWVHNTSHAAGWLAGFLDGEGHVLGSKYTSATKTTYRAGTVGFTQNVGPIADHAARTVEELGFKLRASETQRSYTGNIIQHSQIAGGFIESMRFLGVVRPIRLLAHFERVVGYQHIRGADADRVVRRTPASVRRVIDITTTAGTFIANGYVVHNCGMTGEILDGELEAGGIDRETAHVTNAALCLAHTDKDNERAAECCAPRLLKELAELDLKVPILTLGKAATRSVLGIRSILLARGFVWTAREDISKSIKGLEALLRKLEKGKDKRKAEKLEEGALRLATLEGRDLLGGRTVFPMLHPTFAFIHNETWAPIFRIDMDRAARWLRGVLTHEMLADRIERVKSLKELRATRRSFIITEDPEIIRRTSKILGKEVGVDIETERAKPLSPLTVKILCVQISDGERGLVIAPWDATKHAAVLSEFLKGRTAVFHNGWNFDMPALERPGEGVSFEGVTLEDTLVAHHAFASCFPQKLDHVVATFLDSSPWKVRFGVRSAEEKGLAPPHADEDDLYVYGASDAQLTILAWHAMQKDLELERAVYTHDKELGWQGKELQVAGVLIDRERQRELSTKLKARAAALKGRMRRLARRPNFQPSKLGDVRHVLFRVLKAPMLNPTATGLASTSNATLEVIRTGGDTGSGDVKNETRATKAAQFAEALLAWRVAGKVKSTYVDALQVHPDGRVHYTWRPYGTVSGRFSCRMQSNPRWSTAIEERTREQYIAPPDHYLFYFDLAQAEARFAANLSGDEAFIKNTLKDVHTGNALILFTEPDQQERLLRDPKGASCPRHAEGGDAKLKCNCGKPQRDIAKNAGFAVTYLAGADKVFAHLRANGFPVDFENVELMLGNLKTQYWRYYEYVAENVAFCQKNGYLRTAVIGRIRWFGFNPKPNEISNYPVQSGIADVMNERLLRLQRQAAIACPGTRLVAQVHDAAIFEVHKRYVEWSTDAKGKKKAVGPMAALVEATWAEPVRLKPSIVCREEREFLLPADIKVADRWSAFG